MSKPSEAVLPDPLTEARMEIVALKLSVQVLAAALAVEVGGSSRKDHVSIVKVIWSTIDKNIDNIDFASSHNVEEWRAGIRKSVDSIFQKFGQE